MADFLLELLSEEIPARMQARARADLARMFAEELGKTGLEIGAIDVHSTPRRLVLIARDVAAEAQAAREEIKGPKTSAPAQALEGFLRKTGLAREQLEDRDGVLFAVIDRPGRPAVTVIGDALMRILADFPWPKSMRWGGGDTRWVRPLHGIVALLGEEIVPFEIGGVASGATTFGHRFHHPGAITIGGAGDYAEKLRACHVIVDQDERERLIRDGAEKAAADAGLKLLADEGLVVENAGLTEWPVPLIGRFDSDYLDVPREVIVLTMRTNQKYFACILPEPGRGTSEAGGGGVVPASRGGLAPAFVCIANIDASDGGEAIVEGNRRVLAARLADARFFWEQDLKVPLEEQAKKLDGIIFHEKLGTVADKVERVAKLARWLVEERIVKGADGDQVDRAARLAKADLVTGMVGEFPELQGVIGGHLARAQGEPAAIADAIRDHYKPVGQGDEVPTAPVTVAVSLADKLDTIAGFFAIEETPTGSKDPYALRRAAIGILRILEVTLARMPVAQTIIEAAHRHPIRPVKFDSLNDEDRSFVSFWGKDVISNDAAVAGLLMSRSIALFFGMRLISTLKLEGKRHDFVNASFGSHVNDFNSLRDRANSLQGFIETDEGRDLLAGYKRTSNILKKEKWEGEKRDSRVRGNDKLEAQEQALVAALDVAEPEATAAVEAEDFTRAMAALARLRKPIDEFFDHVTVNDPDPAARERRLNLLLRFRDAVHRVADFAKIEG
ncbi:MAG: glycine--tRNA ligase subunit beta [Sphingomicrobium sp.]